MAEDEAIELLQDHNMDLDESEDVMMFSDDEELEARENVVITAFDVRQGRDIQGLS